MAHTLTKEDIDVAHLDDLARALSRHGHLTMIVTDGVPRLTVLNRAEPDRYATVICERGPGGEPWFWWSWADRIAPVADLDHAATVIDRSLR
ncbi:MULTISPECIES: hypothetical protein [Thermomonospora]|uniref:Uncharacterized protein n=1 Tax=Thermomonospora cellulosilytica TaxID=1411118 RepID=A0A7W3R9V0_9ACTN|nr:MULTISPECIES: hypothetical protein [Thermomonospora]MBA9005161.1 hypothetical protein [Thermomonospora cellulosilytica]